MRRGLNVRKNEELKILNILKNVALRRIFIAFSGRIKFCCQRGCENEFFYFLFPLFFSFLKRVIYTIVRFYIYLDLYVLYMYVYIFTIYRAKEKKKVLKL